MSKPLASVKSVLTFSLLAAGLIGCGGEVDSSTNAPAGAPAGSSATNAGGSESSNALADCRPGFPSSEATADRPCRFFVGNTCYSTQDEACGCACPRDQGPVLCVADGDAHLWGTSAYGVWCEPK